jgi:ribose transport system ATP-binding protein
MAAPAGPSSDRAVQDGRPAVRLSGVSKTFETATVLRDLDLEIRRGEIHALMGQNGSGKSTTVKILSGFFEPDPGATAEVDGKPFELGSSAAAMAAGLRFVHQNLGLVDDMSVADNFMVGSTRGVGRLRPRQERARVAAALAAIGFERVSPDTKAVDLTAPERTAVAIARALDDMSHVPLLVLDEPTSSLPREDARTLFGAMRRITDRGTAILYISHHLDEVLQIADRVSVLRDGALVGQEPIEALDHDRLVELMLGRRLNRALLEHDVQTEHHGEAVLTVRNLSGVVVDGVDLHVSEGEVLGVAGLVGSGSDEIAGLLSGRAPRDGEVIVRGRTVSPADPSAAIRSGLCTVPVDRSGHAVITDGTVRENVTLSRLRDFWTRGRFDFRAERRHVRTWVDRLEVRPTDPERRMTELSGGNQQKVVVGRWLRVEPTVLVLEEPTQGVDIGSKADLHGWVERVAAAGTAVVLCSTDTTELARLSTRVVVMRHGKVAGTLVGDAITSEAIERHQLTTTSDHTVASRSDIDEPKEAS